MQETTTTTARLASALQRWQAVERQAIEHMGSLLEHTANPLIRELLEIVRQDSLQHHRVQQFLIDSLAAPVQVTPADVNEVWDEIKTHDAAEEEALQLAIQLHAECEGIVERCLLDYLIYDEEKHGLLLRQLERFKDSGQACA